MVSKAYKLRIRNDAYRRADGSVDSGNNKKKSIAKQKERGDAPLFLF